MTQTALVTGASGLLGRQVAKAFEIQDWNVVGTGLSRASPPSILKVDLTDEAQVGKALDDAKYVDHVIPWNAANTTRPQVVIHCAAQRFPDKVDADPQAARDINITASKSLATATSSRSILLVYISTDYVFPGTEGQAPYESTDKPAPTNLYGQTKLDGEKAVLEVTGKSGLGIVLRVPVLYGPTQEGNKESAINTLMDSLKKAQDEKVVMDDWSIRYPTNTEDVARVCVDIANKYTSASVEERSKMHKILQFSSEDRYTKYEICEMMADVMGMTMGKMEANKQGNDPNAKVQRPYDCHLSTKALKELDINVHTQDFKAWW